MFKVFVVSLGRKSCSEKSFTINANKFSKQFNSLVNLFKTRVQAGKKCFETKAPMHKVNTNEFTAVCKDAKTLKYEKNVEK